jgi:hypothetical protein
MDVSFHHSVFLPWARRTSIRTRYQTARRDEFGRAAIAIDDAFDQRWSIVIGDGCLDGAGQLSATLAFSSTSGIASLSRIGLFANTMPCSNRKARI